MSLTQYARQLATEYRQYRQRPPKVRVGRSRIHSIGLFMMEDIQAQEVRGRHELDGARVVVYSLPKWLARSVVGVGGGGQMIVEYVGELIRQSVADLREKRYEARGVACYMFKIDNERIVDATFAGNVARFANHACEVRQLLHDARTSRLMNEFWLDSQTRLLES